MGQFSPVEGNRGSLTPLPTRGNGEVQSPPRVMGKFDLTEGNGEV